MSRLPSWPLDEYSLLGPASPDYGAYPLTAAGDEQRESPQCLPEQNNGAGRTLPELAAHQTARLNTFLLWAQHSTPHVQRVFVSLPPRYADAPEEPDKLWDRWQGSQVVHVVDGCLTVEVRGGDFLRSGGEEYALQGGSQAVLEPLQTFRLCNRSRTRTAKVILFCCPPRYPDGYCCPVPLLQAAAAAPTLFTAYPTPPLVTGRRAIAA